MDIKNLLNSSNANDVLLGLSLLASKKDAEYKLRYFVSDYVSTVDTLDFIIEIDDDLFVSCAAYDYNKYITVGCGTLEEVQDLYSSTYSTAYSKLFHNSPEFKECIQKVLDLCKIKV